MTRDRLDELLQHCSDLGIEVEWRDLGSKRRGEYQWVNDRIVLNPRMTGRQCVSALAHEIGHAEFRDTCSTPRAERRAWEFGASLVITPAEYAIAEALVGHRPAALAIELDVTPKLIEAWRRWFVKRYPREYWARREEGLELP